MDNEMIDRCVNILMKHTYGLTRIGAAIVAVEFITAMREPTEHMKATEGFHTNCCTCGGHVEGWQAGIDAIINE